MSRDPQKRAFSREVDKVRKRTRTAIQRLEKQAQESSNYLIKRHAREKAAELQKNLTNLSARGQNKTYLESAQKALENLSTQKIATSRALKSQKLDFTAEMNAAKRGDISALGSRGEWRVRLFYKATQPLWEGKPMAERDTAIIDALGVKDKQAAYVMVMKQPEVQKVWRAMNKPNAPVKDTDSMAAAYRQAQRTRTKDDYPNEFGYASLTEWAKAYA